MSAHDSIDAIKLPIMINIEPDNRDTAGYNRSSAGPSATHGVNARVISANNTEKVLDQYLQFCNILIRWVLNCDDGSQLVTKADVLVPISSHHTLPSWPSSQTGTMRPRDRGDGDIMES